MPYSGKKSSSCQDLFSTDDPVRIGKISYINDAPVYYGLDHGLLPDWMEMVPDVPSVLNRQIVSGQIQISPISAAFYAQHHQSLMLLPDLSISCNGRVLSVILASQYPMAELSGRRVRFTQESASAAAFLKMIFSREGISPDYEIGAVEDCQRLLKAVDAVLVIGDTALVQPWAGTFKHCYDLGQVWHDMTGLPFVFAVWAVRKQFAVQYPECTTEIHRLLLASRAEGDRHMDEIVSAARITTGLSAKQIQAYFDLLYCDLDAPKKKAMEIFFTSLCDQGILKEQPVVTFFKP